jgi:hypothetical protein
MGCSLQSFYLPAVVELLVFFHIVAQFHNPVCPNAIDVSVCTPTFVNGIVCTIHKASNITTDDLRSLRQVFDQRKVAALLQRRICLSSMAIAN